MASVVFHREKLMKEFFDESDEILLSSVFSKDYGIALEEIVEIPK